MFWGDGGGSKCCCAPLAADLQWEMPSSSRTTTHEYLPVSAEVVGEVLGLLHCQVMEKKEMQTEMAPSWWWQLSWDGSAEQCVYRYCSICAAHRLLPLEAKVGTSGASCPPGHLLQGCDLRTADLVQHKVLRPWEGTTHLLKIPFTFTIIFTEIPKRQSGLSC